MAFFSFAPRSEDCSNFPHNMAPRLNPSKLLFISDMIQSQSLTRSQIAEAAECSEQTVKNIRRNLRLFGNVYAPPTRIGRRSSITPPMLEALCDHLLEKPGLYSNIRNWLPCFTQRNYPKPHRQADREAA
jgi:hypothetical protein